MAFGFCLRAIQRAGTCGLERTGRMTRTSFLRFTWTTFPAVVPVSDTVLAASAGLALSNCPLVRRCLVGSGARGAVRSQRDAAQTVLPRSAVAEPGHSTRAPRTQSPA